MISYNYYMDGMCSLWQLNLLKSSVTVLIAYLFSIIVNNIIGLQLQSLWNWTSMAIWEQE